MAGGDGRSGATGLTAAPSLTAAGSAFVPESRPTVDAADSRHRGPTDPPPGFSAREWDEAVASGRAMAIDPGTTPRPHALTWVANAARFAGLTARAVWSRARRRARRN
jgi:hypothetical protein